MQTGFYPFWFWNDRLSTAEIRWQIAQMAAQGVRGFFIHPRQGLAQPYLSEAFFEMADEAIAAAEEHGLTVHLYDEYPYPSGIAGGQVILDQPQFMATQLVQRVYSAPGGPVRLELPEGKVLCALAYPVEQGRVDWTRGIDLRSSVGMLLIANSYRETGLTQYNQKRYFASRPTPVLEALLPAGPHRIFVAVQALVQHHKYWGGYVDVLDPAAVRLFLELTHERYRRRYGERFGGTILSIFTDEVQPGWSDRLPSAFWSAFGYDLCAHLPALQDPSHPEHLRVMHDLHRLRYELFCQAFEQPVAAWCQANSLLYTGEKPSLRMAQLRFMDIPGCEPGHTKAGAPLDLLQTSLRGNAKATASAAYFYGKAAALDECYHSLGWSGTLQDARLMADAQLLMGITWLVPHGFFYSTHGLKKHDAPPSFFFQSPFWPLFGRLAGRVDRIGRLFDGTHIDAQIIVVEPSWGLPDAADREAYSRLMRLLMENHLDFHFADADILASGQIAPAALMLRDLRVRLVIVPPMQVMEPALAAWLEQFAAAGGQVVHCPREFAANDLLRDITERVAPSLRVQAAGHEAAAVYTVKRVGQGKTLWFVLNTAGVTIAAELDAGQPLRELPLEDGRSSRLVCVDGRCQRLIHPFEGFMLAAADAEQPGEPLPIVHIPLSGPAAVRPLAANLLRLAEWRMTLLDDAAAAAQSAAVPALPLSDQLERGGFRFAPAVQRYFGHEPELRLPTLRLRYEYTFDNGYAGPVAIVMEPGSLVGDWQLWVNDGPPLGPADFGPTTAHVRGSLGCDVTGLLRPGGNMLRIEVRTDRPDGGLLNPLYLAGDFGVELAGPRLAHRSAIGAFERYEANGLAFYAGVVEYTLTRDLVDLPIQGRVLVQLETEQPFHEACQVSINGGAPVAIAWQPYTLELDAGELRSGLNEVTVHVHTTLIRAFEGQWFDYDRHAYRPVGETGGG
ncbi:MAG: hypothetical protein FJ011_13900 [Chloroflexi bacterium]|nr:hypothetical protein [Chloroflexota bacterium]